MNLGFDQGTGDYYLICQYDFDAASFGRQMGFLYDKSKRRWVTRNLALAHNLGHLADANARMALAGDEAELRRQFANSTASHAEFYVPRPSHQPYDYYPYQKAGIAYALERPGTLIADEMGLGKTIQAIGVINMTNPKRVLIICPASLKYNWRKELRLWLVPPLTYGIARGSQPWPLADLVIVNYELLGKFSTQIQSVVWDLCIVDEFHSLKNEKALRYKHFKPIRAVRKIALTGTPYPNYPAEIYTCIHWLKPDEWPTKSSMRRYIGFRGREENHLEELQQRLRSSIMIRRLKKDVLTELPPKTRQVITLPSAGLRELVDREKEEFKKKEIVLLQLRQSMMAAKDAGDIAAYRKAAFALREGVLGSFNELAKIRKEVAIAKLPYVIPLLVDAATEGKIIVFGHHHEVLDTIAQAFGSSAVVFDGRKSLRDREAAVVGFQTNDKIRVFCGGFRAAGVGITLTASSHVVFAELDWVPGVITQAEDRAHRLGQRDAVLVWHTVLQDSLDARMVERLISKQEAIERGLNHDRI